MPRRLPPLLPISLTLLLVLLLHAAQLNRRFEPGFLDFDQFINTPALPASTEISTSTPIELSYPELKQKLIEQLMRPYKRYERPTEGTLEPTRVYLSIKILAVTSVDVINMQYTADMILTQTWMDPRLKWNHLPEYSGIANNILLTHKRNDIWLPDLFFRNGKEGFLYKMTVPNHKISVSPSGRIYFSQKITMRLACEMHLRNFPMDQQDCDMDIGSYGYTIDQLKFVWNGSNSFIFADDMLISEFNTPAFTVTEDCTAPGTTSTGTYSCLLGRFQLKRQIGSYLVGTYVPAFLIVIVSWLTFWVSPDAIPARVTLGLLTLISLLTKIASLNNTLPRVSYIKAIDIWLIACLIFVIASMLEFTLASYWSRKVFLSKWRDQVRRTVRVTLDRVVCPCCSPNPHKILMRCTCCGLIDPQYKDTAHVTKINIPMRPPSHHSKNDEATPQHCACARNSCRAVKFDFPIESSHKPSDWIQIYDNKGALDHSPHPTIRQNNFSRKYQTWDHGNCTTAAVLVASPKTTTHQEEHVRSRRSPRHQTQAPHSNDIPMSILPSSRQRRKGQKVTFSSHSNNRRNRRSVDTALCQQHPLPERYLRVREVEIDEETESTKQNSSKSTEDGDLNSEIDAYSSCGYWGFYLIISDPGFSDT
nr:Cys loop ligand gated ion channel subunit [Hymenolepis microstoma]